MITHWLSTDHWLLELNTKIYNRYICLTLAGTPTIVDRDAFFQNQKLGEQILHLSKQKLYFYWAHILKICHLKDFFINFEYSVETHWCCSAFVGVASGIKLQMRKYCCILRNMLRILLLSWRCLHIKLWRTLNMIQNCNNILGRKSSVLRNIYFSFFTLARSSIKNGTLT